MTDDSDFEDSSIGSFLPKPQLTPRIKKTKRKGHVQSRKSMSFDINATPQLTDDSELDDLLSNYDIPK